MEDTGSSHSENVSRGHVMGQQACTDDTAAALYNV